MDREVGAVGHLLKRASFAAKVLPATFSLTEQLSSTRHGGDSQRGRADAPLRLPCVPGGHVVELHDLTEPEGAAFMRDARRLSAAVQAVTAAVKLSYEVHGNTIPHLQMHFYPRYPGRWSIAAPKQRAGQVQNEIVRPYCRRVSFLLPPALRSCCVTR